MSADEKFSRAATLANSRKQLAASFAIRPKCHKFNAAVLDLADTSVIRGEASLDEETVVLLFQ